MVKLINYSYEETLTLLRKIIHELYGIEIINVDDNLYRTPYGFKAYDIVYVLVYFFNLAGCLNTKFSYERTENATFYSLRAIAKFLMSL